MDKKNSISYVRYCMAIPLMLVVGTIGSIDGIGLNLSGTAFAQQPRANFTSTELQLPTGKWER